MRNNNGDMPECDKACISVFHMTGGRHRTDCALHRYEKAADYLDAMKLIILSGRKIPRELVECLSEFVET